MADCERWKRFQKEVGTDAAEDMSPFIRLSEITADERPNALPRGLIQTAGIILGEANVWHPDASDKQRAMWRLLDAAIILAEGIGETEIESGLSHSLGWTFRKGKK